MIEEKNFGEDLIHKIKDEHLHPKARWRFLLKNYVVWGLGAFLLFLGAAAMSLVFYMLPFNDMPIYLKNGGQFWMKLLLIIPIFWLVCLIVFILLVIYNIKHTKKGYRYPLLAISFFVIGLSVLLGGLLYKTGIGRMMDDLLGRHAPFYDQVMNPRIDFWSQPNEGRLMGIVTAQSGDNVYSLIDKNQTEWTVFTDGAKNGPDSTIEIGRPAGFLGQVQNGHEFKASDILPTMPGRGFFDRFGPPPPHGFDRIRPDHMIEDQATSSDMNENNQ